VIEYATPSRNLFVLQSKFNKAQLDQFVNSESWGPYGINITDVADLKFQYTPGGIHADDFLNWEYSISYVNNMMRTYEELSCGGQAHFEPFLVKAFPVNETQNFILLNSTVKPDFGIQPPFEILVSSAVDQETMVVTGIGKNQHGKVKLLVERNKYEDAKDLVWRDAPFECSMTTFPAFAPDEWTCDPALYWNQVRTMVVALILKGECRTLRTHLQLLKQLLCFDYSARAWSSNCIRTAVIVSTRSASIQL